MHLALARVPLRLVVSAHRHPVTDRRPPRHHPRLSEMSAAHLRPVRDHHLDVVALLRARPNVAESPCEWDWVSQSLGHCEIVS